MSKHDEARRAFLVRAAVGAGAVAGAGLVPDALAQNHERARRSRRRSPCPAACDRGPGHGAFFNHDDAATIAAFTERLMPGAPGKPGARDAGVLNYIDLALAGAYADLQDFYRRGLAQLDAYCRKTHNEPFVRLDAARAGRSDHGARSRARRPGSRGPRRRRSSTPCARTRWKACSPTRSTAATRTSQAGVLVGFPGAQPLFTPADMQSRASVHAVRPSSACKRRPQRGGDEPWQPKRLMSSSSAWARRAGSSRPSSAKRA